MKASPGLFFSIPRHSEATLISSLTGALVSTALSHNSSIYPPRTCIETILFYLFGTVTIVISHARLSYG